MKQTMGEKINSLRKQKKMTQDELAEKMGVSPQAVSKWEKDLSIPDLPILIGLSDFFHISLDALVREKEATVQLISAERQKDSREMFLRVNVDTAQGDRVKINLPLAFIKIAAEMNVEIPQFNGSELLRSLDLNMIISLIESGIIGKIVEVESGEGDFVEVIVE